MSGRGAGTRQRLVDTALRLLEVGARIIRTEPELVLKSRRVSPLVLLGSGFCFAHPTLPAALARIALETPRSAARRARVSVGDAPGGNRQRRRPAPTLAA